MNAEPLESHARTVRPGSEEGTPTLGVLAVALCAIAAVVLAGCTYQVTRYDWSGIEEGLLLGLGLPCAGLVGIPLMLALAVKADRPTRTHRY